MRERRTSLGRSTFQPASRFEVAAEPHGDITKVVWPDYVKRAGPEVQRLYEFQLENGALMRYMRCFCGCGADGHRNNRDCYVKPGEPRWQHRLRQHGADLRDLPGGHA